MNMTAIRFGVATATVARAAFDPTVPKPDRDSSHGSAIVTPAP
jgi:hypothetical protein